MYTRFFNAITNLKTSYFTYHLLSPCPQRLYDRFPKPTPILTTSVKGDSFFCGDTPHPILWIILKPLTLSVFSQTRLLSATQTSLSSLYTSSQPAISNPGEELRKRHNQLAHSLFLLLTYLSNSKSRSNFLLSLPNSIHSTSFFFQVA